jgi:hypothetical protein
LTVDLSVDDDDVNSYNVYMGTLSAVHVPSSNSKVMSELDGSISLAQYDGTGNIGNVTGIQAIGYARPTGAGSVGSVNGIYSVASSSAASALVNSGYFTVNDTTAATTTQMMSVYTNGAVRGTVTDLYGVYVANFYKSGATVTNQYGFYSQELAGATNSYFLWYDSPGVFRVKADGVMAYYNPAFTKYTPGATAFERVVQQWTSNVAEIGTEAGSTGGTQRALRLLGSSVEAKDTAAGSYVPVTASAFKTTTVLVTATDGSGTPSFTANMAASTGGPTTAAQNGWLKMLDSTGATVWVPVWK